MALSDDIEVQLGYDNCRMFLDANGYDCYDGQDFYEYIFPDNEVSGETHTNYSKPNAIYLYQPDPDSKKLKRRIMLKDKWEDDYIEYVCDNTMTLCSGLAYRGLANKLENAQQMNALIFDIDGVGIAQLRTILARTEIGADQIRSIPLPTFIVLSGTGVHLYYVFDKPIALFPNIKRQLQSLKHDLTFRIWDYKATSSYKKIQYQGINQGFRMVGSINSKYGFEVVAFKIGDKVSLDYMNSYVSNDESKVDITKPFRPTQMSREEAAEKFPEWYERVVKKRDLKPKKWDIAGKVHGDDPYALYHWWMRQVDKATGGHRYFFMMNMAIYACKCDVPEEILKADLMKVYETLRKIPHTNAYGEQDELDEHDVVIAMEAYSKEYYGFKISDHESTSGIEIQRNRRNGQSQADHLEEARAIRDIRMKRQNRKWTDGNGRPKGSGTAKEKIYQWRTKHPDGTPKECIEQTGISKNTVYKWWRLAVPRFYRVKPFITFDYLDEEEEQKKIIENEFTKQTDDERKQLLEAYQKIYDDYHRTLEGDNT